MPVRRTVILIGILVAALVAGGVVVVAGRDGPVGESVIGEGAVRLAPDDPGVVARGAEIYAEACAGCHGAKLEGEANWRQRKADGRLPAPPHDRSGHTWHHPDFMLFLLTKHGPAALMEGRAYETDMPGFADSLSDREIVAVLSYIKSTWPPAIRARHDKINARAAAGG